MDFAESAIDQSPGYFAFIVFFRGTIKPARRGSSDDLSLREQRSDIQVLNMYAFVCLFCMSEHKLTVSMCPARCHCPPVIACCVL